MLPHLSPEHPALPFLCIWILLKSSGTTLVEEILKIYLFTGKADELRFSCGLAQNYIAS